MSSHAQARRPNPKKRPLQAGAASGGRGAEVGNSVARVVGLHGVDVKCQQMRKSVGFSKHVFSPFRFRGRRRYSCRSLGCVFRWPDPIGLPQLGVSRRRRGAFRKMRERGVSEYLPCCLGEYCFQQSVDHGLLLRRQGIFFLQGGDAFLELTDNIGAYLIEAGKGLK